MGNLKRVAVTGAAGQIGYSLLPRIAAGEIFGPGITIALQCLEIPPALGALEGVKMELQDCSFPLLKEIVCTSDPEVAFAGADLALLVGSKPRGKGMERKDLIRENGPIFVGQGNALGKVASPDVRVIVVGNPCNTNCLIALNNAGDLQPNQFSAMTQLDHNRAKGQLALKAGAAWADVKNPIIWGNHSNTQYPDWHYATIGDRPAAELISDEEWLRGAFIGTVQERGKAIIEARGLSSAASAANAALDHARFLFRGTPSGSWTSMAVPSDGSYGVPEGLVSSFPVECAGDGSYRIVQDLKFDDFGKEKFEITINELLEEREMVQDLLR